VFQHQMNVFYLVDLVIGHVDHVLCSRL
jgi:hypothetical protein